MRVCIVTGVPFGGAGATLPAIASTGNVELCCVIVVRGVPQDRGKMLRRKMRKILRIGPLGAVNGLRLRKWYHHSDGQDVFASARRFNIPVVEVNGVNSVETISAFRKFDIELGISLGNGYISRSTFDVPKFGMINYHGELLPQYPGALSIIWPIYFGLTKTGFTIHRIDTGIDTGPILLRQEFDIAFRSTLRETVEATGRIVHPHMPDAIAEVLSNWERLSADARPNTVTRSFTTPTIAEFARMSWNNRKLFRETVLRREHAAH